MPEFLEESIKNLTQFSIWEIEESEDELSEGLTISNIEKKKLNQLKSHVHRKGYLATRQLLKKLGIPPGSNKYDQNGAPYLIDGRYLSITHSRNFAAVAISDKKVGIDLEFYREKIKKIGPRFLNIEETETSQDFTDIKYLTKIWTAKEALYKIYSTPGINFKSQLHIQKSSKSSSVGFGSVYDKGKTFIYNLYFRYYEKFCLSLATSKF